MSNTAGNPNQELTVADTVAQNLGHLLKVQRWSARQAAFKLGLTPMYVSRRISGDVECTSSDLALFAKHLNVSVHAFFEPIPAEWPTTDYGSEGLGRLSLMSDYRTPVLAGIS